MASNCYGSESVVIAGQDDNAPLVGNTLPALVLAAATGTDYIAHQLVMTKDDHLVALDTILLGNATNVASIFPERKREDGNYYAVDFSLVEMRQLSRVGADFEAAMDLRIPSFEDILLLTEKLEKELGRKIGIYPEIKNPWFHAREGKDISNSALKMLKRYGYKSTDDAVFLACYDPDELQRIHKTLMPAMDMDILLVQILDTNSGEETKRQNINDWVSYNYDWMFTNSGLKLLSSYIDAIGLKQSMFLDDQMNLVLSDFMSATQASGMQVHAILDGEMGLDSFYKKSNVEALVTGDWSETVEYLKKNRSEVAQATNTLNTETEGTTPLN